MSGFLTNLLARSAGPMATIRPRLPSLFEPQRGAAKLPVDSDPRESAESTDVFRAAATQKPNDVPPDAIVRHANRATDPKLHADPPLTVPISRTTASMPHAEALTSRLDTPQNGILESAREQITSGVLSLAADREPAAPSGFGSNTADRVDTQSPPQFHSLRQPPNEFSPASVRDHVEASRTNAVNPTDTNGDSPFQPTIARAFNSEGSPITFRVDAIAGEAKPTDLDSRGSLNQSPADGRFSLKPGRSAVVIPKIESASEPIVHVSIDRIEVRAVAPLAPSPRAERAAQPVMSLKEYMRRRAPRTNFRESIS
jgi:hypothetical protein